MKKLLVLLSCIFVLGVYSNALAVTTTVPWWYDTVGTYIYPYPNHANIEVGIGTDRPSSTLHVSGTSIFSGLLQGFSIVSSTQFYSPSSTITKMTFTNASGTDLSASGFLQGGSVNVTGLTATRLVQTSGAKDLQSVADLTSWVAGTASEITVGNDGDGTITISLPSVVDLGASSNFTTVGLNLTNATATGNISFDGEIQPDGATCADGEILKKTGANNWDCAADAGGTSASNEWQISGTVLTATNTATLVQAFAIVSSTQLRSPSGTITFLKSTNSSTTGDAVVNGHLFFGAGNTIASNFSEPSDTNVVHIAENYSQRGAAGLLFVDQGLNADIAGQIITITTYQAVLADGFDTGAGGASIVPLFISLEGTVNNPGLAGALSIIGADVGIGITIPSTSTRPADIIGLRVPASNVGGVAPLRTYGAQFNAGNGVSANWAATFNGAAQLVNQSRLQFGRAATVSSTNSIRSKTNLGSTLVVTLNSIDEYEIDTAGITPSVTLTNSIGTNALQFLDAHFGGTVSSTNIRFVNSTGTLLQIATGTITGITDAIVVANSSGLLGEYMGSSSACGGSDQMTSITSSATGTISITCSSQGSGGGGEESGWRRNNPFVYLATSTDLVGIGATSTDIKLNISSGNIGSTTLRLAGVAGQTANILSVASSSGGLLFSILPSGQANATSGSATVPAYSFDGDSNLGIFRITADELGITTAGTQRFSIDSTDLVLTVPFRGANGTAAAPTFSFSGDANNGLYLATTDAVSISTASTERIRFDANGGVGINQSSPEATFHIKEDTSFGTVFLVEDSDGTDRFTIAGAGGITLISTSTFMSHVNSTGTIPSVSSCGTSPSIVGTDNAGRVTAGSGVADTSCTITFAERYKSRPVCTLNNETLLSVFGVTSSSTLVISSATSLNDDIIHYICHGID